MSKSRAEIEREIEDLRIRQRYQESEAARYRNNLMRTYTDRQAEEKAQERDAKAAQHREKADAMYEGLLSRFRKGLFE
jgi:hypothetical protein